MSVHSLKHRPAMTQCAAYRPAGEAECRVVEPHGPTAMTREAAG
jgi:hypothetical protein